MTTNTFAFSPTNVRSFTSSASTAVFIAAAAFLAVLGAVALEATFRVDADKLESQPSVENGEPWQTAGPNDIAHFMADWERSLTGRYALSGTLKREALSLDQSTYGVAVTGREPNTVGGSNTEPGSETDITLQVRQAQLDGQHRMYQVGGAATVVDPANGRRDCQRRTDGFWCSAEIESSAQDHEPQVPSPAAGVPAAAGVAVSGDVATHRLYRLTDFATSDLATQPGVEHLLTIVSQLRCWEARALSGDQGHRWGRRSQFCFDDDTGALVLSRTFGQYRAETFIADQLWSDISLSDLDPQ